MDFSFRAIHDVVHPTAAFSGPDEEVDFQSVHEQEAGFAGGESGWETSQLNPKNRITSLAPLLHPLWRLDGSTGFGTQYYAIPLFLADPSPMRIDVFIHEGALYPPLLRQLLNLDRAFSIKDAGRLRQLGITQHILRILQWHTVHPDGALHPDVVARYYQRGPFGSRIVIDNLSCHIHKSRIHVYLNYPLEEDLLPYRELLAMWGLSGEQPTEPKCEGKEEGETSKPTGCQKGARDAKGAKLPPEVDIHDVILVRQLHDSVCEVHIKGDPEYETKLILLKSLNSSVKYLYHELRTLLRDVPAHEHVIGRPRHVISKPCMFGGKRGVVGFTLPYYPVGTLRDVLPILRLNGRLALDDQLRWACQLARAMCHIWYQGQCYYPDLRLDNIVLSGARPPAGDVVVIDFEQRGVWSSFSAPEVDFVENLRILSRDDADVASANPDHVIPEEHCEHAKQALAGCWVAAAAAEGRQGGEEDTQPPHDLAAVAAFIAHLEDDTRYTNPAHGYNIAWICLTRREQEAAMVYMLGRVLWCIFEGMSAPHRGAVWQSYRWEPEEVEFPSYLRTPPSVQELITRCLGEGGTREQNQFVRRGGKIYMKEEATSGEQQQPQSAYAAGGSDGTAYRLVADNLVSKARKFWQTRLAEGAAWLQERNCRLLQDKASAGGDGDRSETAYGRPTLRQVSQCLSELQGQLAS
ncbi:hypothetical protein CMQ_909 [Grosmannia clavigera kw1407]|uniref:Protein kinase domain-containing protein n=1 Tax=Grosmannia clavigera (strain kw1407 / UAMH 11150) TaxID=655863 RepID=F0XF14_GROCL|nr:uncharacterized protein CMQ_909 [Grosmannia clavigera kw1407]EFX03981.1 hypothetical protein CMQ_909 [Grosmannia clavigera kw1407]